MKKNIKKTKVVPVGNDPSISVQEKPYRSNKTSNRILDASAIATVPEMLSGSGGRKKRPDLSLSNRRNIRRLSGERETKNTGPTDDKRRSILDAAKYSITMGGVQFGERVRKGFAIDEREENIERITYQDPSAKNCLLLPSSPIRRVWEWVITVLLLYTLLFLPYRIAFTERRAGIIDLVVDIGFVIDIFMSFIRATESGDGIVETDHKKICQNYARFWLWIDIIAVIPFEQLGKNVTLPYLDRAPSLLRLWKLTRLFKMLRAHKLHLVIEGQSNRRRAPGTVERLCSLLVIVMLVAHFSACIWYLMGHVVNEVTNDMNAWIELSGNFKEPVEKLSEFQRYIVSLYWSVTTLTTVGYGDIVAANEYEMVWASINMLFGTIFVAYMTGALTTILGQASDDNKKYHTELKKMWNFIKKYEKFLSSDLQDELIHHLNSCWREKYASPNLSWDDLREWCDEDLQFKIVKSIFKNSIEESKIFERVKTRLDKKNNIYERFFIDVASNLQRSQHENDEHVAEKGDEIKFLFFVVVGEMILNFEVNEPSPEFESTNIPPSLQNAKARGFLASVRTSIGHTSVPSFPGLGGSNRPSLNNTTTTTSSSTIDVPFRNDFTSNEDIFERASTSTLPDASSAHREKLKLHELKKERSRSVDLSLKKPHQFGERSKTRLNVLIPDPVIKRAGSNVRLFNTKLVGGAPKKTVMEDQKVISKNGSFGQEAICKSCSFEYRVTAKTDSLAQIYKVKIEVLRKIFDADGNMPVKKIMHEIGRRRLKEVEQIVFEIKHKRSKKNNQKRRESRNTMLQSWKSRQKSHNISTKRLSTEEKKKIMKGLKLKMSVKMISKVLHLDELLVQSFVEKHLRSNR